MLATSSPSSSPTKNPSGSAAQNAVASPSPGFQPSAAAHSTAVSRSARVIRRIVNRSSMHPTLPDPGPGSRVIRACEHGCMPADRSPRAGARAGAAAAGGDWRRELASLTPGDGSEVPGPADERATDAAPRRPLALQFELRRRVPRRSGEWQGPRDEPARRATSVDRLAVRPVTAGRPRRVDQGRAHLAEHRLPGERGRVRPRAVAVVRAVRPAQGQHAGRLPGLRVRVDHPRRVREPPAVGAARRGRATRHRTRRVGCHARGAGAGHGLGGARRRARPRRRPRPRAAARVRA